LAHSVVSFSVSEQSPTSSAMWNGAVCLSVVLVTTVDAASNPLTYTPFWQETSQSYVTLVQKSGSLQNHVLTAGLHFTPWSLLGETYTDMPTSPQTDCYNDVTATTKDLAKYKIGICVVNQVSGDNMVEVVRTFGFNYAEKNSNEAMEFVAETAIKEIVAGYDMMDIQVTKAAAFNEDLRNKLRAELKETYGPVGSKIGILGVTIRNKEVVMPELRKEFEKQTGIQNQIRTEEQTLKMQENKEAIETARVKVSHDVNFDLLKKHLKNEEREVEGLNAAQEEKNKQALQDEENKAIVARTKALSEHEQTRMRAELLEKYKGYAQHDRALNYNRVLADKPKFVIQDSVNKGTQISMLNANVMSYLMDAGNKQLPI